MPPARLLVMALSSAALLGALGCGSATDKPPAPVHLAVTAPGDRSVVTESEVDLSGRVDPPDADVLVGGRAADVSAGTFSVRVRLDVGTNVVDVIATAPGTSPALTAIRLTRQELVEIPDVSGDSPDDAKARLRDAGLRVTVRDFVGPLEGLLPVDTTTCGTDPKAGTKVVRGTTVQISVAKLC